MSLSVDITKTLGNFCLNVAFDTACHETMGLLGASGCGKSMTLKCIAGLVTPDSGRIVLDGRVLYDSAARVNLTPQARGVGYLFQSYALFPNMTVAENIAAGGRKSSPAMQDSLRAFALEGLENRYPRQLSGGQQQRVALARILVSAPAALLLDEPFSALDSYLKWQVELELLDLCRVFPGPVLFVSHNRDEIYRLCHQVCVLQDGRSAPVVPVRQLFEVPTTLSACLLSGCKNISRARQVETPEGPRLEALDWGVTLLPGRPIPPLLSHIGVRAHTLVPVAAPGANTISGTVLRVIEDVFSMIVMVSTPGGCAGYSVLRLECSKAVWAALESPQTLHLAVAPADILLLQPH